MRPPNGRILVREGREIVVDESPGADRRAVAEHILGPGLATLLQQRSRLVLHANAVVLPDGGCVALMGRRRRGKSTLSVLLRLFGYDLWTDDIAVVDWGPGGKPLLHAGPRRAKLTPETAALIPVADRPRLFVPSFRKYVETTEAPLEPEAPRPLRAIVLLERGGPTRLVTIDTAHAAQALACHVYGRRRVAGMNRTTTVFRECAALAGAVPIVRFRRRFKDTSAGDSAAYLARWMRSGSPDLSAAGPYVDDVLSQPTV